MENQNFEDYLRQKKIDPELFRKDDPDLWKEYSEIFNQIHPASFTAQKLFKINAIRRKYLLKETDTPVKPASPAPAKPKFSVKPKIK
jgi:hypothetical protein